MINQNIRFGNDRNVTGSNDFLFFYKKNRINFSIPIQLILIILDQISYFDVNNDV
jgi:hypothetical protein